MTACYLASLRLRPGSYLGSANWLGGRRTGRSPLLAQQKAGGVAFAALVELFRPHRVVIPFVAGKRVGTPSGTAVAVLDIRNVAGIQLAADELLRVGVVDDAEDFHPGVRRQQLHAPSRMQVQMSRRVPVHPVDSVLLAHERVVHFHCCVIDGGVRHGPGLVGRLCRGGRADTCRLAAASKAPSAPALERLERRFVTILARLSLACSPHTPRCARRSLHLQCSRQPSTPPDHAHAPGSPARMSWACQQQPPSLF